MPAIAAPPELQPLIDTIAHLLLRVQDALERERRFTDDAAHELRTPLTAIKTHLQVLRLACGAELHGAAGDALANAQRDVARLHRTLEQLLLLARLEGAVHDDPLVRVDALHAARQAITDASASLPLDGAASGPRIELQAQASAACLAVPEALLVSALRNLLDNALRHSPEPASVRLRIERLPGRIEFLVLDEGPGMNAAELAQAAQRFWRRGGGSDSGDTGSGLGLSIADAIARRYGGELALTARPGAGMEARLRFPADCSGGNDAGPNTHHTPHTATI